MVPDDPDVIAAQRAAKKKEQDRQQFEADQEYRQSIEYYDEVWNRWGQCWEKGNEDLVSQVFREMLASVVQRGLESSISEAVNRFDPSYLDGTDYEIEGYAVKTLIRALHNIQTGKSTPKAEAKRLLSIKPKPQLHRASSARSLLGTAEHWPMHCELCGVIQIPRYFNSAFCGKCGNDVQDKLANLLVALVKNNRLKKEVGRENEIELIENRFPFWKDWRNQLLMAYPGEKDSTLIHRWGEYLTEKLRLEPSRWQYISIADAKSHFPPSVLSKTATEEYRDLERRAFHIGIIPTCSNVAIPQGELIEHQHWAIDPDSANQLAIRRRMNELWPKVLEECRQNEIEIAQKKSKPDDREKAIRLATELAEYLGSVGWVANAQSIASELAEICERLKVLSANEFERNHWENLGSLPVNFFSDQLLGRTISTEQCREASNQIKFVLSKILSDSVYETRTTIDLQDTNAPTDTFEKLDSLPKSQRTAILAFRHAEAETGRELTAIEAHDYLREFGYEGYEPPRKDTFQTYVSRAKNSLGEPTYNKRAGRQGRSTVRQNEI